MKQQGLAPIYIIIIILIILGGGLAFYFLFPGIAPLGQGDGTEQPGGQTTTPPPPPEVVLSLTSPAAQYNVGDTVEVSVEVDTGPKETAGLDITLNYDPTALKLKMFDESASDEPSRYLEKAGAEFETYNFFRADESTGKILFSALMAPQQTFAGKTTVGTLRFEALQAGTHQVSFAFEPNTARDNTNISVDGVDILEGVENLSITVR